MADLNFLTEAFSGAGATPPAVPGGPDVDFLSQSFAQAAPSKRLQLAQERDIARREGGHADIGLGLVSAAEQQVQHLAESPYTLLNAPFRVDQAIGLVPPEQQPPFEPGRGVIPPEYVSKTIEFFDPTGQTSTVGSPARGVSQAIAETLSGLTTPEMIPFALTGALPAVARRAVGAGFSGLMAGEVAPAAARFGESTVTGTPEDRAKALTELGLVSGFAVAPVTHYARETPPAWHEAVINTDAQMMRDYFQRQAEAPQRAETARMIRDVRGATPGRRAAARIAEEEVLHGTMPTEAPVPVRQPAPAGGGTTPELLPGVPRAQDAGVAPATTEIIVNPPVGKPTMDTAHRVEPPADLKPLLDKLGVNYRGEQNFSEVGGGIQRSGELVDFGSGITWNVTDTPQQIADRVNKMRQRFVDAAQQQEVPSAIQVPSPTEIPVQPTPGDRQAVGQQVRQPEITARAEVKTEAAPTEAGAAPVAQPPTPRLLLKSNVFAEELPEFQLAHKDRPGDVIAASIGYDPKGFIPVRGASKLSSYRIPLSELPEGSWEKVKGGLSVDKSAVLDFLNDPGKRRSAMSVTGNPKRFHPEDIVQMQDTKKPAGRPATGAGAPIGEVTVEPKVLERVATAIPERPDEMSSITRAAFDRLLQTNPALVNTLLRRRPVELDDAFWTGVREELAKMPEYADDPRKPDALVQSLKALKDSGSSELEWYQSRGGRAVEQPITVEGANAVVNQMVGGAPENIRFISDPNAPLGRVSYLPGALPRIELNLAKHATPEALRDTLLEELIHPLQSDMVLRQALSQIEARITEADIARQREAGYRPDELFTEAANQIVRDLYAQHAEANVFRRSVNQVVLAVKRAFGLQLTDQQVALFLVNRALKNRRAAGSGKAFALESPEKVEEYTAPMTHAPEFYHGMARVLNKGLVPPPVMARFEALSPGAKGELAKVFPGRIATYLDAEGNIVPGPSFREVMRDATITPEARSEYARNGLAEYRLYREDRQRVFDRLTKTKADLDEAVLKAITSTPKTNESELLATNMLGGILDKIKDERGEAVEGAQINERIREGIDNIDRLNELMVQPVALDRAMRGIANEVGRDDLMRAKPGEEVLQLISEGTEFPGGVFATPREWISALATHLDQLTRSDGNKAILASRDVIEAALYGLRQLADSRQALLEIQMTGDGTLRRFNEEYLADLQSKVPKGFTTVLKKYAQAQVESDALKAAFKRLNKRIDTLTEREINLGEATTFLTEHDLNHEFVDFGKAVTEYTGARDVQFTTTGPVVTYNHPITGEPVRIEHTYDKGDQVATIQALRALADSGLEYAARPDSDPQKAAYWRSFASSMDDYLAVASPDYDLLQDPMLNPLKFITKSQIGILAESTFSRIPGFLKNEANRALMAWASAVKVKNAFQKDNEAKVLGDNTAAARTHPGMSLGQWKDEVASLIIDSKQHYGQTPYKAGDRIIGFGHEVTREDMKAVESQYRYEQILRRLHERIRVPVVAENPAIIKEGTSLQRLAMSRGPGTVTRNLPRSSQNLPKEWMRAVEAPIGEDAVNQFLKSGDNFVRIMLGHVMEEERDYVLLGKGPFAKDYKAMRLEKQALQDSGEMPNNIDSLSEWLADHHNDHLAEGNPAVTPGDVRKALIEEVTKYMGEISKHTAETESAANAASMNVVVYENGFTRPRGGKIAPGTLYDYGIPDRAAMVAKGNDAVEFYTMRYRDALQALHNSMLDNRTKLAEKMREMYGSEGIGSRRKLDRGIRGGSDPMLERQQLTWEETNRNISRTSKLLNNIKSILDNRQQLYGDDIANRIFSPMTGSLVGSVLMRPLTWIRNASSGVVLWAMMTGEIRKGGWLAVPQELLKSHIASFVRTLRIKMIPKDAKQAAYKRAFESNPEIENGITNEASQIMQEAMRREELRRVGVIDTFSTREYLGLDSERTTLQNIRVALDTLRNVGARPETSLTKEIFSYLGIAPRASQILTRKIGMRNADNWINSKSTQFANSLAESLRYRAIKSFDARLENDPVFRQIYEEYGDNFQRFILALVGRGEGAILTPAELTGKFIPHTTDRAAIQLRRLFAGNNDSVDSIMLKYWWNQRHPSGNRQAPFMTDGQNLALMFAMAENVNMGTLANRAQWFAGSKLRQMAGVLGQYWLWNTDKLVDLMSKPRGQRTLGIRYLPGTLGFLLVSALAGVISTKLGQEANNAAFNTVSQKPDWWDATDDATRLKILASNAGGYWGAIGSLIAKLTDQPGKLGYNNPIFFANVLTDVMNLGVKSWQSGDVAGPTMDFLAKYFPPAQAVINRLPGREGLVEVRNAANSLRAATPSSLEAKRRQPSAGSDFNLTPMTPLYNGIVNAAERGAWGEADELMAKAVDQQRAQGNANPESAILSAIRTRSPESAVYQRALTPEERETVYSRMTPEARAQVEKTNAVFDELAMRYGRGGGTAGAGGGSFGGLGGRISAPKFGQLAPMTAIGGGTLSLGSPSGVRRGFRTRSLLRGGRSRSLLRGGRLRRLKTRLPRLRV